MFFWRRGAIVLTCCSLFPSSFLLANVGQAVTDKRDGEDLSWWQATHQSASMTIDGWANSIDSFLSGREIGESDDSYVRIQLGPIISENSVTGFFDLKARLRLPNTQDRLRLIIESDGDSLLKENVLRESSENNSVVDSVTGSKLSTALRYVKKQWGAEFDLGILVDFPLDPFLRFRFRQGEDLNGGWRWWQQEEAFAYYSKGVGARYALGVDNQMTQSLDYGSDFGVTWLDDEGSFYSRENFFINHTMDEKNRLRYQLSFLQSGESKLQAESFLYYVQYEHLLHKNWLIGRVKPQMTYEADKDYQADPSLTLSVEILLGKSYLH